MGTERDFVVKKGLQVTDDINVSGDINVSSLYGRLNFKKNAAGNVNNDAIYFINGSDQYAGAVKYFHGDNTLRFDANQATQLHISDGAIFPPTDNDVDLGTSSLKFKDSFFGLVDAENFKVNGGQGSDGQILTSTGSGVAWEDAAGGGIGGSIADNQVAVGSSTSDEIEGSAGLTATLGGSGTTSVLKFGHSDGTTNYTRLRLNGNNAYLEFRDQSDNQKAAIGFQSTQGIKFFAKAGGLGATEALRITPNDEWGLQGANYGTAGQVLTSGGSGAAVSWADAASGGASALNGLTDVISNITNFTDSILISPDNAAPPHGTLSSANDNLGIGKDALKTLTSGTKNVVIGNYAGDALTTNRELVLIGYNAGSSLTGNKHETVVIGSNALSESADSSSTVAIGQSAGQYAEGFNNVMVGNSAGKYWQNTGLNSQKNVFIGSSAGNRGTVNGEQTWVTAIGADAGNRTAIGSYSTIIGGGAGQWTRGESNTFIGQYAGQGNTNVTTSSNNNVAIGRMALYGHQMTSSGNNVAIGPSTLYNTTTGSLNIALGNSALNDVTSGNNNIGIGFGAGDLITTADKNITIGYDAGNNITTGSNNVVIGGADVPSATGNDQLVIASGDGSPTWITGASTGVVDFPNGLTNNGVAIESAFETITDVTIGSGTSGTTSGIYFGANNEAGIVAGEVSSVSTANDGYIELMNMDLDSFTGASGLQTIELTIQIEDETNGEVESFKALVQATEKTVLGTTVRAVNFTEWAILFDGSARIGTLAADYDSSDDTIRIRYQNKQGTTATLTATFYAITMQNNT